MNKKFIDLFAGLGGFHLALSQLGCECVFASELRLDLRKLYKINFPNVRIEGDIKKIDPKDIPCHDILCAGFPCQPFSQAGKRLGFSDLDRGNLFYNITSIVEEHSPRYIFLENVSNLKGHDEGNTWMTIKSELEKLNYKVAEPAILSPHQFGIPQHRRRIYIVCENRNFGELEGFSFPKPQDIKCDINDIIDYGETDYQHLKDDTRHYLAVWSSFLAQCVLHNVEIPSFPIWAMEFGATYEFEDRVPNSLSLKELKSQLGTLGQPIKGFTRAQCLSCIPSYSRVDVEKFPKWKIKYIQQNREFYKNNKDWLDEWKLQIADFAPSYQKMEWNCGNVDVEPILDDKIIQFRASGIRVKLPNFSPALNLVGTQIPIFPWVKLPAESLHPGEDDIGRYMTVHEASKLQGMEDLKFGNENFKLPITRCYEALGNAVNVLIIKLIAEKLLLNEHN